MIEDDFYATLKLKSGEEIFAKVAASDEDNRIMLIVHSPIVISEIRAKGGIIGYKVEPWLKTTKDDMFIVNLDNVMTLSESSDIIIKSQRSFISISNLENWKKLGNTKLFNITIE